MNNKEWENRCETCGLDINPNIEGLEDNKEEECQDCEHKRLLSEGWFYVGDKNKE